MSDYIPPCKKRRLNPESKFVELEFVPIKKFSKCFWHEEVIFILDTQTDLKNIRPLQETIVSYLRNAYYEKSQSKVVAELNGICIVHFRNMNTDSFFRALELNQHVPQKDYGMNFLRAIWENVDGQRRWKPHLTIIFEKRKVSILNLLIRFLDLYFSPGLTLWRVKKVLQEAMMEFQLQDAPSYLCIEDPDPTVHRRHPILIFWEHSRWAM